MMMEERGGKQREKGGGVNRWRKGGGKQREKGGDILKRVRNRT